MHGGALVFILLHVHYNAVLPQSPRNVQWVHVSPTSVKLCWEQVYDTEDEKPTKYHVEVNGSSKHQIVPSFSDESPSGCMCEYICEDLKLATTYQVVITAENEDGPKDSEEISVSTICMF